MQSESSKERLESKARFEANAKLIAAAPELLEALQYALERIKDFDPGSEPLIEAAIKKATV